MDDLITATSMALMKANSKICRLRAINAELVAALEGLLTFADRGVIGGGNVEDARAALAKAKEQV